MAEEAQQDIRDDIGDLLKDSLYMNQRAIILPVLQSYGWMTKALGELSMRKKILRHLRNDHLG